jgi:hypothetical protein
MTDDSWQQKWRCSACGCSYAFYSGHHSFLAFCVNCVAKIRAHGQKNAPKTIADDSPEAWAVVADDWLDNGSDVPDERNAKDKAEFIAWTEGGPPTPGAQRYGKSWAARRR